MERWQPSGAVAISIVPTEPRRTTHRCDHRTGDDVPRGRRLRRGRTPLSLGGPPTLGGTIQSRPVDTPSPPRIIKTIGEQQQTYSLIAVSPQGQRSAASAAVTAPGHATLEWDSVAGADAYVILRNGEELPGVFRIEGSNKTWTDKP